MRCPYCKSRSIAVRDTRSDDVKRIRKLRCKDCEAVFYTGEVVIDPEKAERFLSAINKLRKAGKRGTSDD